LTAVRESLQKSNTRTENSNLKSSMTIAPTQYKDRTVSRLILFDFCRIVYILDEEIYSERNEMREERNDESVQEKDAFVSRFKYE